MLRNSLGSVLLALLAAPVQLGAQEIDVFEPEVVIDIQDTIQTYSPRLFRDHRGVLHATMEGYIEAEGYIFPIYIESEDSGRTWSSGVPVVDTSAVRRSRATGPIVVGDDIYVVWQNQEQSRGDFWLSTKAMPDGVFAPTARVAADEPRRALLDLIQMPSGRLVCYLARRSDAIHRDHYVLWSDDAGTTWSTASEAIDPDQPSRSSDPPGSIAAAPNGDLYVVYSGGDYTLRCYRSDDGGETWSGWPISGAGIPSMSVAVAENGIVGVAWDAHVPDARIGAARISSSYFSRSSDRGKTWTEPVNIPLNGPTGNYAYPLLRSDPGGSWHVSMIWNIPFTEIADLYYAVSSDGGVTWSSPPIRLTEEVHIASTQHGLVLDEVGHAFAMWAREAEWPEQHIGFRTNAPPRSPEPDLLQPNDRVIVRPERNPAAKSSPKLLYQLIEPGVVDIFVWDAQGRLVRQWSLGAEEAGEHRLEWDGRTTDGQHVANGVYHWELRVQTAEGIETARTKAVLVQ